MNIGQELDMIGDIESRRSGVEGRVWAPQPDELSLSCQTTRAKLKGGVFFVGYNWGGPSPSRPFEDWVRPKNDALEVKQFDVWNEKAIYDRRAGFMTGVFGSHKRENEKPLEPKDPGFPVYRGECLLWPSSNTSELGNLRRNKDLWGDMLKVSAAVLEKKIKLAEPGIVVVSGRATERIVNAMGLGARYCPHLGRRFNPPDLEICLTTFRNEIGDAARSH